MVTRPTMKTLFRFLLGLALPFLSSTAATISWKAAIDGAWTNAANWSPAQVPGASDTAVINRPGTYTVTLNSAATLGALNLGSGSGIQTLQVQAAVLTVSGGGTVANGGFLVSSNATLSGKLTIDTGGRLDLTGSDSKTFDKLDLFNAGTVRWLAGSIGFSFGSAANVITNAGLWEISADSSFAYGFGGAIPRFVNTGTLRKIAATGTTAFQNLQFENAGLVDVQKGRIQFSNGTGLMAGNWSTAAGASIVFTGGSFTNLSLATFSGAGSADFQTGSLFLGSTVQPPGLQLSGGSLNLLPSFQGGVVTNLTLSGMALRGTNRVTGFLVSSNATLSGKLTIDTGGRLDLTGSDSKTFDKLDLFNAGTVRWLGVHRFQFRLRRQRHHQCRALGDLRRLLLRLRFWRRHSPLRQHRHPSQDRRHRHHRLPEPPV